MDSQVTAPRRLLESDITATCEKSFAIMRDCTFRSVESRGTEHTGRFADRRLPTMRVTSPGTSISPSLAEELGGLSGDASRGFMSPLGTRVTAVSIHPCAKSGSVTRPTFFRSREIPFTTHVPLLL